MSGSDEVADRDENESMVDSGSSELRKPDRAPLSVPSADNVVTVLVCARVIWFCCGARSAATSFSTRPFTSSPDPIPVEVSPAIVFLSTGRSGLFVDHSAHALLDALRELQGLFAGYLANELTRRRVEHADHHP